MRDDDLDILKSLPRYRLADVRPQVFAICSSGERVTMNRVSMLLTSISQKPVDGTLECRCGSKIRVYFPHTLIAMYRALRQTPEDKFLEKMEQLQKEAAIEEGAIYANGSLNHKVQCECGESYTFDSQSL